MLNPVESTNRGSNLAPLGSALACTMAGVLVATCAFMMGMVESINLFERIMVMLASGALGGSIALTIITMHELGKRE
jgi:hypothetical protein